MPNYKCPLCSDVFEMSREPRNGIPVCSKAGCVKKKQRYIAAGEWEALVDEVGCGLTDRPVTVRSPKKPSSSPTVRLKERTKERILGKAEGPSCTPSSQVVPAVPDVDLSGKMVESKHGPIFIPDGSPDAFKRFDDQTYPQADIKAWKPFLMKDDSIQNHEKVQVPPATLPIEDAATNIFPHGAPAELSKYLPALGKVFRQLPVEDSTTINQQAKKVITNLPALKMDPNSTAAELARLEKNQLKGTKKKD